MSILRELIDSKVAKILDIFIVNKSKFFHLSMVSKSSKVPVSSTFRIINSLVNLGILEQMKVGKMKIYRLAENEKAAEVAKIFEGKKNDG